VERDAADRRRETHEVFRFRYTLDSTRRIMATEVDRPSGRRIVTFNRAGYVVSDDRLRRGSAEAGTA
jgi:hypothetical protein